MTERFEEFTSPTSGIKMQVKPVAYYKIQGIQQKAEKELQDAGLPIDPPTYEVKTAGGGKEKHNHTVETVEKSDNPKVKEKWNEHQQALQQLRNTITLRTFRLSLQRGVVVEMPEDEEWIEEQEADFVHVPKENKHELYFHYIMTEVLPVPEEQKEISKRVLDMSTKDIVNEEEIETAEASFRDPVEKD